MTIVIYLMREREREREREIQRICIYVAYVEKGLFYPVTIYFTSNTIIYIFVWMEE